MKIVCPYCNFSRDVDPAKLPANVKRATCPKCKQKFEVRIDSDMIQSAAAKIAVPDQASPPAAPTEQYRPAPDLESEAFAESIAASTRPMQEPDAEPAGVPWEDRPDGFFGDMWATTKMVLFSPGSFFSSMPINAGTKGPLGFGVLTGTLGMLFTVFYQVALAMVGFGFGDEFGMSGMNGLPLSWMLGAMVGVVILTPLMAVIGLYIGAAIVHFLLMIVRGSGGGFEATFRVLAYGSCCQLLNIIPILGGFISGLWGLVITIVGLSRVHNVGAFRVILGLIVVPVGLIIILAVGIALLAGGMSY